MENPRAKFEGLEEAGVGEVCGVGQSGENTACAVPSLGYEGQLESGLEVNLWQTVNRRLA